MNGQIAALSAGAVVAAQLHTIADQLAAIRASLQTTKATAPAADAAAAPNEIPVGTPTLTNTAEAATVESATRDSNGSQPAQDGSGPSCATCGSITQRAGSCYCCMTCGNTTGCS